MKSVKVSLMTLCISLVLAVSIVIGSVAIISIETTTTLAMTNYSNAMNEGYNSEIKSQVQSVITVLQTQYDKYKAGKATLAEAQAEACEIVRNMRYGDDGSGYFWIDDTNYILVMHPVLPEQEGNNRKDLEDQNGVMIVQEILKTVNSTEGGGYNEFYFTKSDGVTVAPKVAYSQIFEPWGWVVSTGNYVDDMQAEMAQNQHEIEEQFTSLCTRIISVAVVMTVLASVAAWLYGRKICSSLNEIQHMASRLSDGDLTTPITVKDKSELGRTADALNKAQEHMVGLITDISQTSKELEHAVDEFNSNFTIMEKSISQVNISVSEIAGNTTNQARSTNDVSGSVNEIAGGIESASHEVDSLDNNSKVMQDYSDKSMDALKKLIEVNNKTKADIDSMYAQTESTNKSVQKINQAATFISEIADQTNLLSLNASIEAARAGEAGRGFAVVAEEIGKLAAQSLSSANEISDLINELTLNSQKSVEIMQKMNKASELQVDTLEDTQKMFMDLKTELNSCVASVHQITEKIDNINTQRERMTENIDELNQLAIDNAASTEETSAMTKELDDAVQDCAKLVKDVLVHTNILVNNASRFKL